MQDLHERYSDQGLVILAFPCNQFGKQEPGSNADIKEFVKQYKVEFLLFDKINVNGPRAHPLWKWLKKEMPGTLGIKGMIENLLFYRLFLVIFCVF